jgi:hypothetical protein
MKHVCVAARIGDGEALGAANIVNIRKASNNASADSGRNPGNDRSENLCLLGAGASFGSWHCRKPLA